MDFTEAYSHSNPDSFVFSPSSTFFTCVAGSNPPSLLLRTSNKFHLVRQWTFNNQDKVSSIEWSMDGQYLLVVCSETGTIYVLFPSKKPVEISQESQVEDADGEGWSAKLTAGAEGLTHATWLPSTGPPSVLQFALDDVRATATNLNDYSITVLPNPKRSKIYPIPGRPTHFAMLERKSSKDYVGIYSHTSRSAVRGSSSGNLELERSFPTNTNDSIELSWSPDGKLMAVWEKSLEYKVHIFSPLGHLRSTFMIDSNPNSNSSEPITISTHSSIEPSKSSNSSSHSKKKKDEEELTVAGGGLGIRCVSWKPGGKFLVIGGYDDKIRILEDNEWTEAFTFDLAKRTIQPFTPPTESNSFGALKAWSEPRNFLAETNSRGIVTYNEATLPIAPAYVKATADPSRTNPKMGVSQLAWNDDGTLSASRSDSMPTTVFIHAFVPSDHEDTTTTKPYLLAILSQIYPIQGFCWKPGRNSTRLAICCGTSAVYLWELFEASPNENSSNSISVSRDSGFQQLAEAVSIPNEGFMANSLKWSPDGTKLILIGPDSFCCATDTDS